MYDFINGVNVENIILETERLILKPFADADFLKFLIYQDDKEYKKFMGGALDYDASVARFALYRNFFRENGFGFFSVFLKETNEWIGQAGVAPRASAEFGELGWAILPPFQGKGYAIESMEKVIEWCIDKLGWHEFYFCINPLNTPSVRLAEKLGAYNIGTEKVPEALRGHNVEIWYLKNDNS